MRNYLLLAVLLQIISLCSFAQSPSANEKLLYATEVFFDFGKHELRRDADSILSEVVKLFAGSPNLFIAIEAHTDSIGTLENNEALSSRRCEAVKVFLTEKGMSDAAFTTSFLGETSPVATNSTDQGRQLNRRARVVVWQSYPEVLLQGKVTDINTGKALVAEVVIHGKDFRDSLTTDTAGFFQKYVPPDIVIGIDAFAKCYFLATTMVKTQSGMPAVVLQLRPAVAGEKMDIQNLYFVGNQAVLLEKSKPELPRILRFMQLDPGLKIEIAGHVNFPNRPKVDTQSWEFKLSEARAKLVYDFLLKNDIPQGRISWKGYGNWEMRFPNATDEEQQALNRRVELKVIASGCDGK